MSELAVLLLRDHVASEAQLAAARDRAESDGGDLCTHLLDAGVVAEDVLASYWAATLGLDPVARDTVTGAPEALAGALPPDLAVKIRAVPVSRDGDAIVLVTDRKPSADDRAEAAEALHLPVVFRAATPLRVQWALGRFAAADVPSMIQRVAVRVALRPAGLLLEVDAPGVTRERASARPLDRGALTRALAPETAAAEQARSSRMDDTLAAFGRAQSALQAAHSREDVLRALCAFAEAHFAYAAFFAVRGDLAEGLDAVGSGASADEIRGIAVPLDVPSAFRAARDRAEPVVGTPGTQPGDVVVREDLRRASVQGVALLPVLIRRRVVLLVWADSGDHRLDLPAVDSLAALCLRTGEALERLVMQRKHRGAASSPPDRPSTVGELARVYMDGRRSLSAAVASPPAADLVEPRIPRAPALPFLVQPPSSPEEEPPPPETTVATVAPPARMAAAAGGETGHQAGPVPQGEPPGSTWLPPKDATRTGGGLFAPSGQYSSAYAANAPAAFLTALAQHGGTAGFPGSVGSVQATATTSVTGTESDALATDHGSNRAPPRGVFNLSAIVTASARPIDPAVAALLARAAKSDQLTEDDERRIVSSGPHALRILFASFPGTVVSDRLTVAEDPPPARRAGPLPRLAMAFGREALPHLVESLASTDPQRRFYALLCLGEMPDPSALDAVANALFDADPAMRVLALRVTEAFRGVDGYETMLGVLRAVIANPLDNGARRERAIEIVSALRDGNAVPALLGCLDPEGGEDPDLSDAAYAALCALSRQDFGRDMLAWRLWWEHASSRSRIEWLIESLGHDGPAIRQAAGDELRKITGRSFGFAATMPRRDRERAQQDYRDWWRAEGAAQHTVSGND